MGANVSGYQGNFNNAVAANIANGQTTSQAINLNGFVLAGIILPAAFTGTALSFLVSATLGGTYVPLKSTTSGTALSYTVAQGTYAAIDPKDFMGVQFLQIVSNASEGAARTLQCAVRGI